MEDMWRLGWEDGGTGWVWRLTLLAWEEESVRECSVLFHNIVLQDNVHDTWRWLLDPTHGYMVREAYCFLTNNGELVDMTLVDDVWHKHIPSKVSLFVWRLLRNRLPTINSLVRRCILQLHDSACVFGCGGPKTVTHLFLGCDIFSSLWAHVWHWLGISSVHSGDFRNHFIQYTNMTGLSRVTHSFLRIIWFSSV